MHSFFLAWAVAGGILSFVVAAHAADHKYAPEVDWWSPPRCVHAAREEFLEKHKEDPFFCAKPSAPADRVCAIQYALSYPLGSPSFWPQSRGRVCILTLRPTQTMLGGLIRSLSI